MKIIRHRRTWVLMAAAAMLMIGALVIIFASAVEPVGEADRRHLDESLVRGDRNLEGSTQSTIAACKSAPKIPRFWRTPIGIGDGGRYG
jgi:hypothetical protein